MLQLMLLPANISYFTEIQNGSAFLMAAYPGCAGNEAIKWVLFCCTDDTIPSITGQGGRWSFRACIMFTVADQTGLACVRTSYEVSTS